MRIPLFSTPLSPSSLRSASPHHHYNIQASISRPTLARRTSGFLEGARRRVIPQTLHRHGTRRCHKTNDPRDVPGRHCRWHWIPIRPSKHTGARTYGAVLESGGDPRVRCPFFVRLIFVLRGGSLILGHGLMLCSIFRCWTCCACLLFFFHLFIPYWSMYLSVSGYIVIHEVSN